MRNLINLLTVIAVLLALAVAPALADQVNVYQDNQLVKSVVFAIGMDEYFINGQTPGVKMDAKAFIENDRTYVPVRYLGYALGLAPGDVAWDNDKLKATLTRGGTVLEMTVGKPEIITNGQAKAIDVAPLLKSEPAWRTYLPARFVAEGLGYQVDWDAATQTVICWPAGEAKPDVSAVQKYVTESKPAMPVQGDTYTLNGYQVPMDTKLMIDKNTDPNDPRNRSHCEMDFLIDLKKGDLQGQWSDAAAILSQTLDNQTVSEMMAYAEQKTTRNIEILNKFWNSNGKSACVGSGWGDQVVQITIWNKNIN